MKIKTIHFVAGLGARSGQPLMSTELLAISLARKAHPSAELFLHTDQAEGSCSNYRKVPGLRRVRYSSEWYTYKNWPDADGAHQADLLRLRVLLQCKAENALYLDTDAFCMRSLDWLANIEGCAMARLSPFMVANGMIYAGQDRGFLRTWHDVTYKANPPASGNDLSCQLPAQLSITVPGLTILDNAMFHGATGDEALHGFWLQPENGARLQQIVQQSYIVHTMTPRPSAYTAPGTNYETFLDIAKDLACW